MKDFKDIHGQDLAIQILSSTISKGHISTAYLFSGPEGVGRKKTAKVFIKSILDKNINSESIKRKIENNNHPDLLWIEPSYMVQGKSISQKKAKLVIETPLTHSIREKGLPMMEASSFQATTSGTRACPRSSDITIASL